MQTTKNIIAVSAMAALAGCASLQPDYATPQSESPTAFKAGELGSWKQAEPLDALPKGDWWTVFGDSVLSQLQARAESANHDLEAALAAVDQARAAARMSRSELFPALGANAGYRRERFSANQEPSFVSDPTDTYSIGLDLGYELDLFGRIRSGMTGARADAESSVAAYHNLKLTLHADLAQSYFALRALDAEIEVLEQAKGLRTEQHEIVTNRWDSGLGNELDVARARVELANAEVELADAQQSRQELENAIAILVGESPSSFRLEPRPTQSLGFEGGVPVVPAGLPSSLLERRPDVAQAERQLAAENARIGVAKAAFFPAVRLTGAGGYLSAEADDLFDWDSRLWSIGPSVSVPIFQGGRNKANLEIAQARFDAALARYRQQVLVAFGDVENALSRLQRFDQQSQAQDRALDSAQLTRDLALEGYEVGLTGYLDVIEADRAALQARRASAQLSGQRYIAAVQLIKALGGGWNADTIEIAQAR